MYNIDAELYLDFLVTIAYWIWFIWFVLLLYNITHYTLHPALLHYSKTSKIVFEKNAQILLLLSVLYTLDSRLNLKRRGFHLSSASNLQDGFRLLLYLDKWEGVICIADLYTCVHIYVLQLVVNQRHRVKGCPNTVPDLKTNFSYTFSLCNSMTVQM